MCMAAGAGFLLLGLTVSAAAQGYQPSSQARLKDAYCSGFFASQPLPSNLRVARAEGAAGRTMYSNNELIYLSQGRDAQVQVGQRFQVVRRINNTHPSDAFKGQGSLLRSMGRLYRDVSWVEVVAVHPTTSTARISFECGATMAGDVVIPFEERPLPDFNVRTTLDLLAPPTGLAEGMIVAGKELFRMVGDWDPIYVNLGTTQGVKVGDSLRIFRSGRGSKYLSSRSMGQGQLRRAPGMARGYDFPRNRSDLPREILGEAFVVHVDTKSATAIINFSRGEIHAGDLVELQPPLPPQVSLTVVPASIERGGAATLSWAAKFAQQIEVSPSVGPVSRRGTQNVTPTETTTYTLTASGPGGGTQTTATLTVVQPPPPPPPAPPAPPTPPVEQLFTESVQDIFFEFDQPGITAEAAAVLQRTAEFLLAYPEALILIEGHCDEVGTDDYNLRLGTRRAEAARDYLVSAGVSPERLQTVSVGRQQPFCTESSDEPCRQLNRRAHFVLVP